MRTLALAAGAVVLAGDVVDLVKALVVPRPHTTSAMSWVMRHLRVALRAISGAIRSFERRDRFLALAEPVLILTRLVLWMAVGLLGFALVIWGAGRSSFAHAAVESGSSIFTLGFASERGAGPEVAIFTAAGFGLVVVALQIAYLPALYNSFNRRETLVSMLESRAGTPAWGPELLARHYLVGIQDNLPSFYAEWEQWAADVAESHTTYPSLLYFRSPHPTNSWVVGLVAVLDSAALYLALSPERAPAEARLCVRMGFTALRDVARAVGIPFDPDPMPDGPVELSRAEFDAGVARLERAGVPQERSAEEAWPHFVGWRVNYESIAYALAQRVDAPPALWTGPRRRSAGAPVSPVRPVDRRPGLPEGRPADRV